jgi:predicted aldo/keto reductase-like oxidoreductase
MGSSDLKVSAIGFGCWEMGGNQYGAVDDREEVQAVHRAIDLGVTLFDTLRFTGMAIRKRCWARRSAAGARTSSSSPRVA